MILFHKDYTNILLAGLFFITTTSCTTPKPDSKSFFVGIYFNQNIKKSLKQNTTHVYFEEDYGTMIIPILMLPENQIFLNEEAITSAQVGEKIDSLASRFSPSHQRTFNIHLRVHGDVKMRILSEVKEQMKAVGAMRLIYSRVDE